MQACRLRHAHTYKTLLSFPVEGLRADVARLALVSSAHFCRDRIASEYFLFAVLLGSARFFYWFAELIVAALFPVLSPGPQ